MIKAIDTFYNGYYFRSRTEARWAVFFDAMGIKYEYEKEGYELPSGRYLPDFWLPDFHLVGSFAEVKGASFTGPENLSCAELCEFTQKPVLKLTGAPDFSTYRICDFVKTSVCAVCERKSCELFTNIGLYSVARDMLTEFASSMDIQNPELADTIRNCGLRVLRGNIIEISQSSEYQCLLLKAQSDSILKYLKNVIDIESLVVSVRKFAESGCYLLNASEWVDGCKGTNRLNIKCCEYCVIDTIGIIYKSGLNSLTAGGFDKDTELGRDFFERFVSGNYVNAVNRSRSARFEFGDKQ